MRKTTYLTLGQVAKRFGCRTWQVARLFEREILPEPKRIGILRVISIGELETVRAALEECGYMPAECPASS
jgi:hypothetical protein